MRLLSSGRAAALRLFVAAALLASTVTGVRAPALAVGGTTGSINGTVTDSATHAPVAGVTVSAVSPTASAKTTTDAKGFFSFVGLPVDTYAISYALSGYEPLTQQGITVQGDQQVTANGLLTKSLTRIGRTQSRAASAAFQPKQTTDSYQVTGTGVQTALGRAGNISQTQLQSSVPSVTTTFYGSSSIRGSTRTEIAYQFDGIDYTDPLTSQFQNSLGLNGLQALQVNPGAGDASQGNAGAGAINIVVKRGSRPAFGNIYYENDGYPRGNYGSLEWGWATPNGRVSNYTSYVNQIVYSWYGPPGSDQLKAGAFLSTDYSKTSDLINNFVYKFGHDNSRSIQFLYQTRYSNFYINHGGIDGLCYKTCDANVAPQLFGANFFNTGPAASGGLTAAQRQQDMQRIIGLLPGQTDPNQNIYYQGFNHQPVDVLKLEYSQQLDARTYWTNRIYRVIGATDFDRPYDTQSITSRVNLAQGGIRNGLAGDILHQFGDKHLIDLNYTYQAAQSIYDNVSNTGSYRSISDGFGGSNRGYEIVDFIPSGFPCPGRDPFGNPLTNNASTGTPCGYLGQFFPGGIPRVPNNQFFSSGYQHLWGFGLRDQFTVSDKLKLDYGIRMDGSDYQMVNEQGYGITNATKHPRVTEPRFAGAYQFGARDALRVSYGRSVQFTPAGIINGPVAYQPEFANIPSRDSRTGLPAKLCGPPLFNSLCANYAQQFHDEILATFGGLEAFNVKPSTYSNWDLSYSHQFGGNVGLKLTPFFKRGYDVNVFSTPILGLDPTTGLAIFAPSTLTSLGVDKTTGVEFLLTKDRPIGISGFLALTYVNRLQNVPPLYNGQTEDFYPGIPPASLALGNLYRAGYLSPLNGRLGINYRDKSGFRVNPIVSYDRGFPQVGAGLLAAALVNNVASVVPNTNVSIPGYGIVANAGTPALVTQYVSPTNPGSVFSPNIAATRGTPETALAGGVLTKARISTDIDFEFSKPGSHNTIGLYITNLFNQIYAEPSLNSRWQPVANGIGGPQTGQSAATVAFGPQLGFFNFGPERFGQNAYTLGPNLGPTRFRLYYQLAF